MRTQTSAQSRDTYSDLVLIGTRPTTPDPIYNVPLPFQGASEVATQYGADSDVHRAAQRAQRMGVEAFRAIVLETDGKEETIAGSTNSSVSSGVLTEGPIMGGTEDIDVSVDGTPMSVSGTTATPPEQPPEGEAVINTDTWEVSVGTASQGTEDSPTSGIVVSYQSPSWNEAETAMEPLGIDLSVLADTRADETYLGEANRLVNWSVQNKCAVILAYANGDDYESDLEAMNAAHRMGSYMPSGNILPIAHKSDNDVSAGVAGRIATKPPWFDPFWDGYANYGFALGQFRAGLIGDSATQGTFEGGDSENGAGAANVLQIIPRIGIQALTNSLTPAGSGSAYKFWDTWRTESFINREIQLSLIYLRLRRDKIPFADVGRTMIEEAIDQRLRSYVSSGGVVIPRLQERERQRSVGSEFDQPSLEEQGSTGVRGSSAQAQAVAAAQQPLGTRSPATDGGFVAQASTSNTTGVAGGSGGAPIDPAQDQSPGSSSTPTGDPGTDDPNVPLSRIEVNVPAKEDLPYDDRANRVWSGIEIVATLAGNVHSFRISLDVQV